MLTKNRRFVSLLLLALVIGLVSFADSAFAGKGQDDVEQRIRNQNAFAQLVNPNR